MSQDGDAACSGVGTMRQHGAGSVRDGSGNIRVADRSKAPERGTRRGQAPCRARGRLVRHQPHDLRRTVPDMARRGLVPRRPLVDDYCQVMRSDAPRLADHPAQHLVQISADALPSAPRRQLRFAHRVGRICVISEVHGGPDWCSQGSLTPRYQVCGQQLGYPHVVRI
jgi:hypothetical protein